MHEVEKVKITPRNKASGRTKNRLEHGPEFVLTEKAQPVRFDNGAPLRS